MKDSASKALTDSVVTRNVSKIAEDMVEVALDSALNEGILKEIPFVSWLVRGCAISRGIRDRLFLKKVALFLLEAANISPEEREAFSKRLIDDADLAERCGDSALLLIDKLSEFNKARLMGYAFRRFVQGSIDSVELHRIYAALEFLPLWQLTDLPRYYFAVGLAALGQGAASLYQQLWLIEVYYGAEEERLRADFATGRSETLAYHQPIYRETPIGRKVAEIVRDYLSEPE